MEVKAKGLSLSTAGSSKYKEKEGANYRSDRSIDMSDCSSQPLIDAIDKLLFWFDESLSDKIRHRRVRVWADILSSMRGVKCGGGSTSNCCDVINRVSSQPSIVRFATEFWSTGRLFHSTQCSLFYCRSFCDFCCPCFFLQLFRRSFDWFERSQRR